MDDVFADIDHLLDGRQSAQLLGRSPAPEVTPMQSVLITQGELISPPYEPPLPPEDIDAEFVIKRGWGYYTERLLFICSCASLVGGILWLAANDQLKMPQFLNRPVPTASAPASTEENGSMSEFAGYIQRALDNIDRQANGLAPENSDDGQNPQVIERIYIPIYPPNFAAADRPGTATPGPALLPPPPNVELPQAMTPSPPPQITTTPLAIVPPPAPSPSTPAASGDEMPTIPAAPKTVYTLVGILEAGDRSEALFKINGTTQRFRLGEELGSGSWKLIAAQNNQVILERAGQTRTVYVGQDFPSN
ncbi:hypothetical protein FLX56_20425 [Synechococcus moorigangaii CMS01]|nr:hypothetical protein [Synechococcus moorigangaii CMS01]